MNLAYRYADASFEGELEQAAEQMSSDIIGQIQNAWDALPSEIQDDITRRARQIWDVRGAYLRRFLTVLNGLFARNRAGWQQGLLRNRAATAQQLAVLAGQAARLPARRTTHPKGMSPVQVGRYHRRQQARGRVPGRAQQRRSRESELEVELDCASRELEGAEPFWTRVTPIPGIGTKMGHELLTQEAMKGLTELTKDDRYNIETGVIRPDRGGRSYWKFPRAALAGLKAGAQPSHSLRPTPSSSVAEAMRLIQIRFAGLHRRAMLAPTRKHAMEWLGEALHLLQDSYSSAHTERAGGTGRIRNIRVFFVRADWPPRSRAPLEHNAPSDPRDDIWESFGRLRPQAAAAIKASRAFLAMALRHLKNRFLPTNKVDLQAFIQHVPRDVIIDFHCHGGRGDLMTAPWNTIAPLESYLRRARQAGIDRTVVLPAFHTDYVTANRELARIVDRWRPRLIGFAMVNAKRDAGRVREMVREAVMRYGFRGLKIHGHDAMPTREVCEAAREFNLPVIVDVVGKAHVIDMFAEQYPDVTFVIAHLGSFSDDWRAHERVIEQMVRYPNVMADTSGVRRFDYLVQAVKRAGPRRLVFGSDGPWLHPGAELHKIRLLGLSRQTEALVVGGNAQRLLAATASDGRRRKAG